MNTLFARLSIALLVIVGLMGTAFHVVDRINTRLYYEELSQTLNAPIAMYVTGQRQLITNGEPDIESLKELASHAMVINPTAEIYLLDTQGKILGHAMEPETVLHETADLAPVQALINGTAHMPIRGDDPRSEMVRKVFSAHPVQSEAGLEGYLYVILGGQKYEELASNIGDSYVGRMSAMSVGDIGLIQRVLENLVRNAIRFTPAGGEVAISIAERSDSLSVAVSDNGLGIPDDDIPRIFDRFYRSVNGEEARSDSSGLGLAIVKRILNLHGGRITVESKVNAGTRFEFELPLYEQAA